MNKKLIVAVTATLISVSGVTIANAQDQQRRQPPSPEQMMQRLDANQDSRISRAEFVDGRQQARAERRARNNDQGERQGQRRRPRMDPDAMFTSVDRNADGFLTLAELQQMPKPPKRAQSN